MTHKTATRNRGLICLLGGVAMTGIGAAIGAEAAFLVLLGVILGLVGVAFVVGAAMMRPN